MKKLVAFLLVNFILAGCAPEIGSPEWCTQLKEKPKTDWTATEAKDFAKYCIL